MPIKFFLIWSYKILWTVTPLSATERGKLMELLKIFEKMPQNYYVLLRDVVVIQDRVLVQRVKNAI